MLLASSGIHANGLSLARKLAERLPQGYLTPVSQRGPSFGEALLAPTVLYSPVTEALYQAGIAPHYAANITGHGWRKLMRHPGRSRYRIHAVPDVPPVLQFIQQQARHGRPRGLRHVQHGRRLRAVRAPPTRRERTVAVAREAGRRRLVAGAVEAGDRSDC